MTTINTVDAAFTEAVSNLADDLFDVSPEGVARKFLIHQVRIRRIFLDYDKQKARVRADFKILNERKKNNDNTKDK